VGCETAVESYHARHVGRARRIGRLRSRACISRVGRVNAGAIARARVLGRDRARREGAVGGCWRTIRGRHRRAHRSRCEERGSRQAPGDCSRRAAHAARGRAAERADRVASLDVPGTSGTRPELHPHSRAEFSSISTAREADRLGAPRLRLALELALEEAAVVAPGRVEGRARRRWLGLGLARGRGRRRRLQRARTRRDRRSRSEESPKHDRDV
jgi:hypothetical protein